MYLANARCLSLYRLCMVVHVLNKGGQQNQYVEEMKRMILYACLRGKKIRMNTEIFLYRLRDKM